MIVCDAPNQLDATLRGGVVSVGNFDGVHLGHAALLSRARELARGTAVIAVTFEPHPITILAPEKSPRRLTPLSEKLRQLSALGTSAAIVLKTDRALLSLTAESFVEDMLVGPMQPSHIVEGPGFGFGAGRRGNVDTLRNTGRRFGFAVEEIEPVRMTIESEPLTVSSSTIRGLLEAGRLNAATRCLGRPYALIGRVVRGAGVGRSLGFPTMNLDCGDQQIPADGVYYGSAGIKGKPGTNWSAAVSIGVRPTFDGVRRVVETHLLGLSGDHYEQVVRVEFHQFVRAQRKFESPSELQAQIADDVRGLSEFANQRSQI